MPDTNNLKDVFNKIIVVITNYYDNPPIVDEFVIHPSSNSSRITNGIQKQIEIHENSVRFQRMSFLLKNNSISNTEWTKCLKLINHSLKLLSNSNNKNKVALLRRKLLKYHAYFRLSTIDYYHFGSSLLYKIRRSIDTYCFENKLNQKWSTSDIQSSLLVRFKNARIPNEIIVLEYKGKNLKRLNKFKNEFQKLIEFVSLPSDLISGKEWLNIIIDFIKPKHIGFQLTEASQLFYLVALFVRFEFYGSQFAIEGEWDWQKHLVSQSKTSKDWSIVKEQIQNWKKYHPISKLGNLTQNSGTIDGIALTWNLLESLEKNVTCLDWLLNVRLGIKYWIQYLGPKSSCWSVDARDVFKDLDLWIVRALYEITQNENSYLSPIEMDARYKNKLNSLYSQDWHNLGSSYTKLYSKLINRLPDPIQFNSAKDYCMATKSILNQSIKCENTPASEFIKSESLIALESVSTHCH